MKFLFFLAPLLLILFSFPQTISAYDLEVQCDRSRCALSSKEAIFSPGVQWRPGMSVEKNMVLKNVDGPGKEIFLDVKTPVSEGELDEYIEMRLEADDADVWSGTLEELISDRRVFLMHLPEGEEWEIIVHAGMDGSTPNDLQGSSSSFDFGFGFEGEQREEEDAGETHNNSVGAGGEEPVEGSGLEELLSGIFTSARDGEVSGTLEENEDKAGEELLGVASLGETQCSSGYMWVIAVLVQIIVGIALVLRKFDNKATFYIAQAFLFGLAAAVIYFLGCGLWPIVVSGIIFALLTLIPNLVNLIVKRVPRLTSFLT